MSPNTHDIEMGLRLRAARTLRHMSQEKLAEACGITFQQIQKYEKGTNRLSYSRLVQVAAALDVPLAELVAPQATSPLSPDNPLVAMKVTFADADALDAYAALHPDKKRMVRELIDFLGRVENPQQVAA